MYHYIANYVMEEKVFPMLNIIMLLFIFCFMSKVVVLAAIIFVMINYYILSKNTNNLILNDTFWTSNFHPLEVVGRGSETHNFKWVKIKQDNSAGKEVDVTLYFVCWHYRNDLRRTHFRLKRMKRSKLIISFLINLDI